MSILVNKDTKGSVDRHPDEGRGPDWSSLSFFTLDSGLRRYDARG
jgi:hypothetical protein